MRYEPLGDAAGNLDMVLRNNDGTYSVRSLEEMIPSTMTLINDLEGRIFSLETLYYTIPCVHREFPIEYLEPGVPHIISVRWDGNIRGRIGKFFPSSVFLSIRLSGRKISARVCSTKLHMTGPKSREEAGMISRFLVDVILKARSSHILLISNFGYTMDVAAWLEDHSKGDIVEVPGPTEVIDTHCGPVQISRPVLKYTVLWPANVPSCHHFMACIIRECCSDVCYTSDIITRMTDIYRCHEACDFNLELSNLYTSMINYNFELCFNIDRREFGARLKEMGYNVAYHNVNSHEVSIIIKDTKEYADDVLIFRKPGKLAKLYETKISVTARGKIKLSGGGGKRLKKAYFNFMSDVILMTEQTPEIALFEDEDEC